MTECRFAVRGGENQLIIGTASSVSDATSELGIHLIRLQLPGRTNIKDAGQSEIRIRGHGRFEMSRR